ncbi:acyl-ACP--UDP-N-acetylglucosamine O-acyltransferase [Psychromarinibacter halotolerans]|uniref:Acyl-[acyl-carrier-protein]--UDP-N-acetylglucosamine O-acyltransferase n=1 Tax=Psychromarinibacter halotolerans TaxID=1775175 RepID=A0ABV7GTY6_9RHOB|nr:acyl-ACP--UDP-N-acetylglucosamine O-acyltransferase [Psychromarinibacter halotolerans]MAQ82442.1 acyl-[acyl-carrier-protein]--UDP-N-acetylglucosamine O-acyltransferase [Maritimibacter sp.]MDF0594877.1 acyl-ACP--UDP-N-acetylglucosamine O-acyltransferase [Psychromarinibacter halotolerans]
MSIDATARIHPSAIIEDGAVIGPEVEIGAFSVIGPKVKLHAGVRVKSHNVITGDTEIGEKTEVFPFCSIGDIPQDLKFAGEDTRLVIGARNTIREHVTMNPGTAHGGGLTSVGDDCLFMAGVHVAHDVRIGSRVIVVNQSGIAGHATIGDDVIIGGISGVHQWVRIGKGAIIGGVTKVAKDVIPYGMVDAEAGELRGLNLVGLRRKGVDRAEIGALRAAYKDLGEGEGSFQERAAKLMEETESAYVREVAEFILTDSDRHFLTPKK